MRRMCGATQTARSRTGCSAPTQESNSCSAWTPACDLRTEVRDGHRRRARASSSWNVAGSSRMRRLSAAASRAAAALDEVRGEREGRASEPDERHGQLTPQDADGLSSGPDRRRARTAASRARSAAARIGPVDDRPDAVHEAHIDADARERRGDVGEQDRRVHAQPADRLERDLGAQRRVAPRSARASPRSRMARYSGKRAAGLAHEPDGRRVDRLPPAGAQEPVVGSVSRSGPSPCRRPAARRSRRAAGGCPAGWACR